MDLEPILGPLGSNGGEQRASASGIPPSVEAHNGPQLPRFHGSKAPGHEIQVERPWHRSAAFMFARGASIKEVAEAHERTPVMVSLLLKNSWFQDLVSRLMADFGGRDIMELFRGEGINTFVTLVELRDAPATPAQVRKSVCTEILDRAFGKPLQRVEQTGPPVSADPVAEVERLEQMNERLRPLPQEHEREAFGEPAL